jgi:Transglutaminase-like superfamily
MTRIRKYLALAPAERSLVREAYATVVAMRIASWMLPFGKVRELAEQMAARGKHVFNPRGLSRERIAWAVMAAGNAFPGGHNCLVRALAGEVMLRRFGYPAELRIGVANPAAAAFKAHAWLESGGRVLIGDFELESYVPLDRTGANPQ